MEKFFSCEQLAKRYKVSMETIWRLIRKREIPALKVGKSYRIRESALLSFEKQNQTINDKGTPIVKQGSKLREKEILSGQLMEAKDHE